MSLDKKLKKLKQLQAEDSLTHSLVGLEKESLRMNPQGEISLTPHPQAFGSALCNRYITTDYSEALLELITPPINNKSDSLSFLNEIHYFVHHHLQTELMWSNSMPCIVRDSAHIPLAQYGNSNLGKMKTVYRHGLGMRYGRSMQIIAGIHFNFSLQDSFWRIFREVETTTEKLQAFKTQQYLALTRNLQRFGWMIPYLFGSSPAICKSFLGKDKHPDLIDFDSKTYYHPYATSLRMGDIGYQNNEENNAGIHISYNTIEEYLNSLESAINTPHPAYQQMGLEKNGEFLQLNGNLLQIENEHYSTIRPKQLLLANETPLEALKARGIHYVELRSLDLDYASPIGISENQYAFIKCFLLYCLLEESPSIEANETLEINQNELRTAHFGRKPGFTLHRNDKTITLVDWGVEICEKILPIAEIMDQYAQVPSHTNAIKQQIEKFKHSDLTPSATFLQNMRDHQECFHEYSHRLSKRYHQHFLEYSPNCSTQTLLQEHCRQSIQQQIEIENQPQDSFKQFLQKYFER